MKILFGFIACLSAAIAFGASEEKSAATGEVRVVMIGDSTMASKLDEKRPETGWGEALGQLVGDEVAIENYAVNGRSSKSFIDEGRWDAALERLRPGDFLIVQFGHNDEKIKDPTRYTEPRGSYQANLRRFVEEARERGASVVLATSISRRKFGPDGKIEPSHGDYPKAVLALAKELKASVVDMERLTRKRLNRIGDEASKSLFLRLEPGEHPNYPDGATDDTHLSPEGARWHAEIFMAQLRKMKHPLAKRYSPAKR